MMQYYRAIAFTCALTLSSGLRAVALSDSPDAGVSSTFSIAHQAEVPGEVLKAGDYSIQIVEHISDRLIIRIDGVKGKEHLIFLGVPNFDASAQDTGLQTWNSGHGSTPALRGFKFPTGTAVDFVYPKAEAVSLAKLNSTTVVAIDPESEGRPAKLRDLSSDDMKEINLWMLTLSMTGPKADTPAIEAKHYAVPVNVATAASSNLSQPTTEAHAVQSPNQPPQVARLDAPAVPPAKAAAKRHTVSELPHTASALPMIFVLGLISLAMASVLQLYRRRGENCW